MGMRQGEILHQQSLDIRKLNTDNRNMKRMLKLHSIYIDLLEGYIKEIDVITHRPEVESSDRGKIADINEVLRKAEAIEVK